MLSPFVGYKVGDSLLDMAAPCFLLGRCPPCLHKKLRFIPCVCDLCLSQMVKMSACRKVSFLGHISVDCPALPLSLQPASSCPPPVFPGGQCGDASAREGEMPVASWRVGDWMASKDPFRPRATHSLGWGSWILGCQGPTTSKNIPPKLGRGNRVLLC